MSDRFRLRWKSGRLVSSPIADGWAIDLDSRDPAIPNLPLETPASGGSQSATFGAAWSLRNNATGSQAGAWSIRNQIASATYSAGWSLRNQQNGASLSGAWSLRNGQTATLSGAWSLRNTAIGSLSGAWSARNAAAGDYSGAWSLLNDAGGTAFASFGGAWSVLGQAVGEFVGSWSIEQGEQARSTALGGARARFDWDAYLSLIREDARLALEADDEDAVVLMAVMAAVLETE